MMSEHYTNVNNQNASRSVPPVYDPPGQISVKFNANVAASSLQTFQPSAPDGRSQAVQVHLMMLMLRLVHVMYAADKMHHKNWDYDIHLLAWSACVLYGYAVFVPITLYIVLSTYLHLWVLFNYYAYMVTPCLSSFQQWWVVVGVAGFMSAMFVASNLRNHIVSAEPGADNQVYEVFLTAVGTKQVILKVH
ncbi:hypothetical protein QVD17_36716 [Tagetes erecta]|uniref:Uncharacterized protein n=1 Tax=Tagetes erecta TaxID=13708 RepID=A0AAD8JV63_TARER|nr:hypothetical protein QVD17_36716 [Tagetes erecta]